MRPAGLILAGLLLVGGMARASEFPPDPINPASVAVCNDLRRDYVAIERRLSLAHDAIGLGRGPQVDAGTCCSQESAGYGWCRTYQSHAAAWEALHCAAIKRRAAVDRCIGTLRLLQDARRSSEAAAMEALARIDPGVAGVAERFIEYDRRLSLAQSWAAAGNGRESLAGLVHDSAAEVVASGHPIRDPLIRELVSRNLEDIGLTQDRVMTVFDNVLARFHATFPGAFAPASVPAASPPAAAFRPKGGTCTVAATQRLERCLADEMKKQGSIVRDASFYKRCNDRFHDEAARC